MTEEANSTISAEERAGIARVIDVLLPGTDRLPPATQVAAQDELLDRVLTADPTLLPLVARAGRWAAELEVDFAAVQEEFGEDTERLVFALHAAYYMSEEVRDRLGYPGQRRLPVSLATPDQMCSDELIEPVISRGPIYVPSPAE